MKHRTLTYTFDELARQQYIKLKNPFNNIIDWILKLCKDFNYKTIETISLKYYFIN